MFYIAEILKLLDNLINFLPKLSDNLLLSRVEKDNANIKHEIEEIKVISDEVSRAKVLPVHVE